VAFGFVRDVATAVPTLAGAIENSATARPFGAALVCPQRGILDFASLSRQIAQVGGVLRSAGIDQRAAVAVALPHGPELALAIAAVEYEDLKVGASNFVEFRAFFPIARAAIAAVVRARPAPPAA
jgi:non-ribosomal peptide synthetase component E (peptide arylation enzyme)